MKAACPARLQMLRWKLEGAKARLSEVVRRTKETGPQLVTQRGRDAVVVLAASELALLTGSVVPFVDFMAGLSLGDIATDRDAYAGHDVVLSESSCSTPTSSPNRRAKNEFTRIAWSKAQAEERRFVSVLTLAEYLNTIVNLPDDDPAVLRYSAMLNCLQERFAYRVIDITREIAMAWGVPVKASLETTVALDP